MTAIDLDSLPPWLAFPLLILILTLICSIGINFNEAIKKTSDSPEVQKIADKNIKMLGGVVEDVKEVQEIEKETSNIKLILTLIILIGTIITSVYYFILKKTSEF